MIYGNHGKLLRINLSERKSSVEEIDEDILKETIGGKGLATRVMSKELNPKVDPLSAENKIYFVTGPTSDTNLAPSSRYGVYTKSPLTGIYAESYAGGHVAPVMKRTGFDIIVLEAKSDLPVFLHISDKGVTFYEAGHLWGMDTYDAEDKIKEEVGAKGSQALVIGPAGENMVRFACIKNNYWRSAGRAGTGAVLGSKNVKGLVFSGDTRTEVADPTLLKEYMKELRDKGEKTPVIKAYREYGTPMMVAVFNKINSFPTRYWYEGSLDKWENLSAEYMQDNFTVKSKACSSCFMACGKLSRVEKGRHKGLILEGPEYETIYSFGGLCLIEELEEVAYLNDICDRMGIDTISAGNIAGLAIEASKRGKLGEKFEYGKADDVEKILRDTSHRRGKGDLFAEGIKEVSRQLGLEDIAIHVKGLEPAGQDPRYLKGMGLGFATSDRGACHMRSTFYKLELDGVIEPEEIEGKAELFVDYEDRLTLFDCMIYCRFYRDIIEWDDLEKAIAATAGIEPGKDGLKKIAGEITTTARRFNLNAGITAEDDNLPERFHKEPLDKEGKQVITREELDYMVKDYYRLRGWNEDGTITR